MANVKNGSFRESIIDRCLQSRRGYSTQEIFDKCNDAFQSVTARREIKKKLRSILWIKYQIKDNDVFEKAYSYIEMYY